MDDYFHKMTLNSKAAGIVNREARREIVSIIGRISNIPLDCFVLSASNQDIAYITLRQSYSSKTLTDSFDYFAAVMTKRQMEMLAASLEFALQQVALWKAAIEKKVMARNLPPDEVVNEQEKINAVEVEVLSDMRQTILRHFLATSFHNESYESVELTIDPLE